MNLEKIAENLARALGHSVKCQERLGYCICGAAGQQAKALDDYEHWKRNGGAKLEAENAGLREHLNWALAHVTTEMCGDECNDYDDHHAKVKKAQEAAGPEG